MKSSNDTARPAGGSTVGPATAMPTLPAGKGVSSVTDGTSVPFKRPPGHTGRRAPGPPPADEIVPVPDRWRIGFPDWERYPGKHGEIQYERGRAFDPYHQNVLKADYPLFGKKVFLQTHVKVRRNWADDARALRQFGYEAEQ